MLAVVVPDASASIFRSPSFLNDASHKAAAHAYGFLPGRSSFLSTMSSAASTTAAGLYVVLNGGHLSTPTEGPPGDVLQAGSYDKNKNPPPRRRENTTKNEENT